MCGAKCHIFDVGGKMQSIWERYYDDCDGIIFCWKLGGESNQSQTDDNDSDDEEMIREQQEGFRKQQELLLQVRQAIPDDVPFLILGHVHGNVNAELVNQFYDTAGILPYYHNPLTTFCCGSAKTGAGIKYAMEWIIPMAKRQHKERVLSTGDTSTSGSNNYKAT